MQVTVRAFATVREALGSGRLEVTIAAGATLADLVAQLARDGPDGDTLKAWFESGHLRLARNHIHARPEEVLADGDEVALFPPTTGG